MGALPHELGQYGPQMFLGRRSYSFGTAQTFRTPFHAMACPYPHPPPYDYSVRSAVRRGGISRPNLVGGKRAAVSGRLTRLPIHVFGLQALCADGHPAVHGKGLARDVQRGVLRGDESSSQEINASVHTI